MHIGAACDCKSGSQHPVGVGVGVGIMLVGIGGRVGAGAELGNERSCCII